MSPEPFRQLCILSSYFKRLTLGNITAKMRPSVTRGKKKKINVSSVLSEECQLTSAILDSWFAERLTLLRTTFPFS